MAIKDRRVSIGNLTRVVQDNDLGSEVLDSRGRLVLAVRSNISSLDVLDRDVLDVEAHIVSRGGLRKGLMVHLHRLDLSGQVDRGKSNNHTRLYDPRLHTTHRNCSNATNLVNILDVNKCKTLENLIQQIISRISFSLGIVIHFTLSDPKD